MIQVFNHHDELIECHYRLDDVVTARQKIYQSPLSDSADVPKGATGRIVDFSDGYIYVDFGDDYGATSCYQHEIR